MVTSHAQPARIGSLLDPYSAPYSELPTAVQSMLPELSSIECRQLLWAVGQGFSARSIATMSGVEEGWIIAVFLLERRYYEAACRRWNIQGRGKANGRNTTV